MLSESEKWPLFSVVIVNYNGQEHLQRCISSILRSDYPNFEIILVDDGSTDDSVKLVNEIFGVESRLKLILSRVNSGPAKGRNVGSRQAKGEYLAFVDNDTEVDKFWLKEAFRLMNSRSEVGAIQCKLRLMDERDKYDYAGDYLSQFGFLVQRVRLGEIDKGQLDEVVEIFAAKSAGMIVRKDIFNAIGGFDEDYFIYMEETDLCWRIWLNGHSIVFLPTSIVYHKFGTTRKIKSPRSKFLSNYHGTKNYITSMLKNLDTQNLLKILPLHIACWTAIIVRSTTKKRLVEAKLTTKGVLYNVTFFGCIWMKRKVIQSSVRKVPDSYLMPRIMMKQPLTYFFGKLSIAEHWIESLK